MSLTVQYTGQLANVVGVAEESVAASDLKSALDQLVARHGDGYAKLVFDSEGEIRPSLLVVLDGEQAEGEKASIDLTNVKNLMLMTPIAGG